MRSGIGILTLTETGHFKVYILSGGWYSKNGFRMFPQWLYSDIQIMIISCLLLLSLIYISNLLCHLEKKSIPLYNAASHVFLYALQLSNPDHWTFSPKRHFTEWAALSNAQYPTSTNFVLLGQTTGLQGVDASIVT